MEEISRYLIERKEDIKNLKDVKRRDVELRPTKEFILSIIGPRRAGKTYLLYDFIKRKKLKDEDYLFVNFEEIDGRLKDFIAKHVEIYGKYPKFLFLDEIQALKGWEKEVYKVYERKRFFIFITGSSSKLLSKEIATQLRGRGLPIKLFPFSFKEILRINSLKKKFYTTEELGRVKRMLKTSVKEGCFPSVVLKKIEAARFFSELVDLVIYKDIMERFGVENRIALEFFIKNTIASNSSKFSINKVYNMAKSLQIRVSKNTLYNFQKFLEDVNMIFFLRKYFKSLRKVELSLPKVYVVDNGIYTFTTYRYDVGKLMESFVFQELMKRGYEPNRTLFYFGDDYEVDFLVKEGLRIKKLIQVTYSSSLDEVEKRELRALIKAGDLLKCKDLLVITWDLEDETKFKRRKIKFLPLWKWLLNI